MRPLRQLGTSEVGRERNAFGKLPRWPDANALSFVSGYVLKALQERWVGWCREPRDSEAELREALPTVPRHKSIQKLSLFLKISFLLSPKFEPDVVALSKDRSDLSQGVAPARRT